MTRSQGCGDPQPATAAAQIQIVDTATEHVGHILGAQTCDFDFQVDDYGGVGTVTDVLPGCAFQPPGMVLDVSDFSPSVIELRWMNPVDAGAPSCEITDTWKLTK